MLLDEISKFVKKNCDCEFMTVDVVQPIISGYDNIKKFMRDPTENKNWDLEMPTLHEIEEQDRHTRDYYEFEPHEKIVNPSHFENLDELRKKWKLEHNTRLICRNIQSSKRTERVQGLLDFYKQCNFTFQITPGDISYYRDLYSTLWGLIQPLYSNTLVAKLYETLSVTDNNERLL